LTDLVLRKRQEIRNEYVGNLAVPAKLQDLWEGPFRVIRKTGPITYEIQLVGTTKTEKAHARDLKPCGDRDEANAPLTELEGGKEAEDLVVARIVDHKVHPSEGITYKVRWKGFKASEDTWEPALEGNAAGVLTDYLQGLLQAGQRNKKQKTGKPDKKQSDCEATGQAA
jgi:hypothetical protein